MLGSTEIFGMFVICGRIIKSLETKFISFKLLSINEISLNFKKVLLFVFNLNFMNIKVPLPLTPSTLLLLDAPTMISLLSLSILDKKKVSLLSFLRKSPSSIDSTEINSGSNSI